MTASRSRFTGVLPAWRRARRWRSRCAGCRAGSRRLAVRPSGGRPHRVPRRGRSPRTGSTASRRPRTWRDRRARRRRGTAGADRSRGAVERGEAGAQPLRERYPPGNLAARQGARDGGGVVVDREEVRGVRHGAPCFRSNAASAWRTRYGRRPRRCGGGRRGGHAPDGKASRRLEGRARGPAPDGGGARRHGRPRESRTHDRWASGTMDG